MKPCQSSQPGQSTGASSSAHGCAPTNHTLENCGLDQLTSELVRRLTVVESLGLLNDTGKSLLLLLHHKTASPSTDGSAPKKDTYGTYTFPQPYVKKEWEKDWWLSQQGLNTQRQNLGHGLLQGTWCGTIPGWGINTNQYNSMKLDGMDITSDPRVYKAEWK